MKRIIRFQSDSASYSNACKHGHSSRVLVSAQLQRLTSVMTPMRSMSRAGLRGSSLGVECPLGGEDEAKEDAVAEAVMEAPWWCIRARLRPSRLTLATRFSISSARSSVDSFSSWISLGRDGGRTPGEESAGRRRLQVTWSLTLDGILLP